MSALNPDGYARSTYLPEGPREEYRGEKMGYRRDAAPAPAPAPAPVIAPQPVMSQRERVLSAVANGAQSTTEIVEATGLTKDQVHKAVAPLIAKGKLSRLEDAENGERRVALTEDAPHDDTVGAFDMAESLADELTEAMEEALPSGYGYVIKAEPMRYWATIDPDTVIGVMASPEDPITALYERATQAIITLRDTFERMTELARENADAKNKLSLMTKMLTGD